MASATIGVTRAGTGTGASRIHEHGDDSVFIEPLSPIP